MEQCIHYCGNCGLDIKCSEMSHVWMHGRRCKLDYINRGLE